MLIAGGCAVPDKAPPRPVTSLVEIRQSGVVAQAWDISCAAAALATVLQFEHGLPDTEKDIAEAILRRTDPLKVRVRGGFSLLDLKRYVQGRGLKGTGYGGLSMPDLERLAPVIIAGNFTGLPHFVVFRGRVGDDILLADPAFGNRIMHADAFQARWLHRIGFVVNRRDGSRPLSGRLAAQLDDLPIVPRMAIQQAAMP